MAKKAKEAPKPEEPPFVPSVRVDGNRRVALEFKRERGESRYLIHAPRGLCEERLGTERFLARFDRVIDTTAGATALRLLSDLPSAYLPGDGVPQTLLEIYTMSKTEGTADLTKLDLAGLTAFYNDLAKAIGRGPVKSFKSKGEAIKRIEAVKTAATKPTPEQEQHKAESEAAAAKKVAASNESKQKRATAAEKAERAAARVAGEKTPKQEAAAQRAKRFPKTEAKKAATKKSDGEAKPRGLGIGAFCMDLIKGGKDNAAVLAAVAKKFPGSKTSAASVAWYRNKLKSEGAIA